MHKAVLLCDTFNISRIDEIIITAQNHYPDYRESVLERYLLVLLHEHLLRIPVDPEAAAKLDKAIEMGSKMYPHQNQFKFFKGLSLKIQGLKKEGNQVLRNISMASGSDPDFTNDLRMLGTAFENRGRPDLSKIVYQEGSKLHLFLSSIQRPVYAFTDIDSKPIWPINEEDIDVSMTQHEEEFVELKDNYLLLLREAQNAMEVISDEEIWFNIEKQIRDQTTVKSGSMQSFPMFLWGMKKTFQVLLCPQNL